MFTGLGTLVLRIEGLGTGVSRIEGLGRRDVGFVSGMKLTPHPV